MTFKNGIGICVIYIFKKMITFRDEAMNKVPEITRLFFLLA